jgi:protein-disulfide isomerase
MRNILIVAGGVVAVAAIAIGVYFGTRPNVVPASVPPPQAADKQVLLEVMPGDHVLGDLKAPITIIEYASLTCGHCASFHVTVLPGLKTKWIDTGKAKLIYRDFPLDQVAAKAAQIAECSGKDKYFAVLDMMFQSQLKWAGQNVQDPVAELAKMLRIGGMGAAEIDTCLKNETIANAVVADLKGGEKLGVNSTPTIFINGNMFKGARSSELIDAEIQKFVK